MYILLGKAYRQTLENNTYLDVSVYPNKWTTTICMSLWEEGNGVTLASLDNKYFNFEKIMPIRLAAIISTYLLNKHSQKVAGFDLIIEV